jgi:hypothetical protein
LAYDNSNTARIASLSISLAKERGRAMLDTEPRAVAARYDAETDRVMLDLANGCVYAFPAALVEDLQGASPADLGSVEVDGLGFNLYFPALDVDLQVPALIGGVFGTKAWMTRELARRAGQVTSEAKALAARANGAKGGRPRKAI